MGDGFREYRFAADHCACGFLFFLFFIRSFLFVRFLNRLLLFSRDPKMEREGTDTSD